jgi:hypothetical protein
MQFFMKLVGTHEKMLNLQTKNWSQLLNLFMNEEDLLLLEA